MNVFEFDQETRRTVCGSPHRLLRESNIPCEVANQGKLAIPPDVITENSAAVGWWTDGDEPIDLVVTGICQGRGTAEDKQNWLAYGPSVETVCNLDAAYAIATRVVQCPLEIWIVDQEYANLVESAKFSSNSQAELDLGFKLEEWCQDRYGGSKIYRTSNAAVRSTLYATLTNSSFARLYPDGVPNPYNNSGNIFWQEIQYLASVAVFCHSSITKSMRVLAIADHEQLRVMAAARILSGGAVTSLALWPCPRLGWVQMSRRLHESSTRFAERFMRKQKECDRRMYRGSSSLESMYLDMPVAEIDRRIEAFNIDTATIDELLRFFGVPKNSDIFNLSARERLIQGLELLKKR